MNAFDFDAQFSRLTAHFHLPADGSRETIAGDWFKALEHYHVDALEHAVTDIIRGAQDRFWPPLGKVREIIKGRISGIEKFGGTCHTCDGSTWVDAWPMRNESGLVYTFMSRCPDCGVPVPQGGTSLQGLTRLTAIEKRVHDAGEWPITPMAGLRPRPSPDKTELRAWCAAMAVRLFGGRAA